MTYRDLAADPVAHLDEDGYTTPVIDPARCTPAQAEARALGEVLAGELVAADAVVIGVPLYNFSVPSTLKAWTDRSVVPGLTLGEDYSGALGGRTVAVISARGGGYGPGTPRHGWDHREPWLRHLFAHLGVTDMVFIDAELTLARESPAMAASTWAGPRTSPWPTPTPPSKACSCPCPWPDDMTVVLQAWRRGRQLPMGRRGGSYLR